MKRTTVFLALLGATLVACDQATNPILNHATRPLRTTTPGPASIYTDQASFEQAVGPGMTLIDFSTRDDGSPITSPSNDVFFPALSLRGVTFDSLQSYYNLVVYTCPAHTIHVELPSGTVAFGAPLGTFYGTTGTFTITLSTGQVVQESFTGGYFPPSDFFGARSDQPMAWVDFKFDNDCLVLDNFEFLTVPVNAAPVVTQVLLPANPVPINTPTSLQALFTDSNVGDSHTGTFSWNTGSAAGSVSESNGAGSLSLMQAFSTPGVYTINATVSDGSLSGSRSSILDVPEYVVVYDPAGSFVTGGGWIDSPVGACQLTSLCQGAAGKTSFGFVAKYHQGATAPSGNTQFQFRAASLTFQSAGYDWLVIAGAQAQFKGTGTINGGGAYAFLVTAIDGRANGDGIDRFRIKIWDSASGAIVYDNQMGADDGAAPVTALGGGSIQIH